MTDPQRGYALVIDLVRSRDHAVRRTVQDAFESALGTVNAAVPADQDLVPTVGDEAQATYADLRDALSAMLHLRLLLPDGLDCRFGIGGGTWEVLKQRDGAGPLQDGPAWWAARSAVEKAEKNQAGTCRSSRSWYAVAPTDLGLHPPAAFVNSLLLCRDEITSSMSPRERRLTLGRLLGRGQLELAEEEAISQSAVSQALRRCGAHALLTGHRLLAQGDQLSETLTL